MLESLSPRERATVELRFGLGARKNRTLEEVGVALGVSRERVRQIKEKAIKRIQFTTRCRILKSYLG